MSTQEQRLFASENVNVPASADSAKSISLYEFGSTEKVVRRIQLPFVKFFRDASPVLDIGCGRGIFLEILSSAGIDAIGLDPSDEAVNVCRNKGFEVIQQDAHGYLAITDRQFGGIFCSHVIEHLAYDDALRLIRLCQRALRPGGVLVLVTPNSADLAIISEIFWLDPTHVRPYPTALLKSMLENSGMKVSRIRHFLGDWHLIGRRGLPGYLIRKLVLGRFYGKPNALVVATKHGNAS